MHVFKSLIYLSKGPNADPWSTTYIISLISEFIPPMDTYCCLLARSKPVNRNSSNSIVFNLAGAHLGVERGEYSPALILDCNFLPYLYQKCYILCPILS